MSFYLVMGKDPSDPKGHRPERVSVVYRLYTPDELWRAEIQADHMRQGGLLSQIVRVPIPRKGWT